eukprot:1907862-Prymnesium_polylepis.1
MIQVPRPRAHHGRVRPVEHGHAHIGARGARREVLDSPARCTAASRRLWAGRRMDTRIFFGYFTRPVFRIRRLAPA